MNAIGRIISDAEEKLTDLYKQPVRLAIITQTLSAEDTMRFITLVVCNALNVRFEEMFEKNRRREIAEARMFIYYYGKSRYGIGPSKASKYFNQNHTTAIHSFNAIRDRLYVKDSLTTLNHRLIEAEFEDHKTIIPHTNQTHDAHT
jgi:chromosomal replication initiation ATPase DnaA